MTKLKLLALTATGTLTPVLFASAQTMNDVGANMATSTAQIQAFAGHMLVQGLAIVFIGIGVGVVFFFLGFGIKKVISGLKGKVKS